MWRAVRVNHIVCAIRMLFRRQRQSLDLDLDLDVASTQDLEAVLDGMIPRCLAVDNADKG